MAATATLHDLYVWKLSKELSKEYDSVSTNVPIQGEKRMLAEIDIIAEKDGVIHIIEVKCSYRMTKAKQQFRKIQKYFAQSIDGFFMYCASSDQLIEVEI